MEVRHLRYFVAVAEELHFSRAARRLHMAQPPLSQQIRNLEAELGMQLLARGRRPLRLTEAGRFFKSQALEILAKLDDAVAGARRINRDQNHWIGVGYIGSAMNMLLPPVLRRFHRDHPEVEVLLYEMSHETQKLALLEGRIHVGFVDSSLETDALAEELLYEEPMSIAVPLNHPLASRSEISLAEIADESIVLYTNRTARGSMNDHMLSLFRDAGIVPKIAIEAQNVESALGLVVAGLGMAFAVKSFCNPNRAGVSFLSLNQCGSLVPMNVIYRSDEHFSARDAFLKAVRNEALALSNATAA
jgi:DNA-binding transcriptional LysR family regulator